MGQILVLIQENKLPEEQLNEIQSRIQELYRLRFDHILDRALITIRKSHELVHKGYGEFFHLYMDGRKFKASQTFGTYSATIDLENNQFKFTDNDAKKLFNALEKKYKDQLPSISQ